MTDQEIIDNLKSEARGKGLKLLYKEFPKINALILSSGGDEHQAGGIFNDSLLLLIEKVNDPTFELTSKLSTYLYGINRFLWMNELKKKKRKVELEWKDTLILSAEELNYSDEEEEKLKLLDRILEEVTDRCKKIFQLFYIQKISMKDIASKLGFGNTNSAKTQKYKCMEHAMKKADQMLNNSNPSAL